jgi:hypothetical protein
MAKTELGCQVLQGKGHFAEFAQFIRQHGLENEDNDLITKLKSILWAVVCVVKGAKSGYMHSLVSQGNIGATDRGLPFLEEAEVIPTVLEIAEQSLITSVRG